MLTEQQMMELFLSPEDPEDARSQLGGVEDDACTWSHVQCEDSKVTSISWHSADLLLGGSIDMVRLPRQLRSLNLYHQPLRGEADTTDLPETLTVLCIDNCQISGTLDLGSLPPPMMNFTVRGNAISAISNFGGFSSNLYHCQIQNEPIKNKVLRVGKLPENGLRPRLQGCGIIHLLCEDSDDALRVML